MESSLRNHALVQQQNKQQQRNREEYYRNNGIIRPSSASAAPASSSYHGNNSARSRNSGSSTSGKGSKGSKSSTTGSSRSTRSGEASDEAVQGLPESTSQHRYHNEHRQHHQQQYHYHHHQMQQHPHHQQQQQRYPQHYQYYSGTSMTGVPQQQQQYDQYGYPVYRDSVSSSQNSHHNQYVEQQHQQYYGGYAGGSAAEATASSGQSHYSNMLGSISGSAASNSVMRNSLSAHGGGSEASRASLHKVRIPPQGLGLMSPSSSFRPFKEALKNAIREREKEDASSSSGSSRGKKNIIRKMTLNADTFFRLWYTEHSKIPTHHHRRRRKNDNGGSSGRPSSRTSRTERSSSREDISHQEQRFARMTIGDSSGIHGHGHSSMLPSSAKKQHGSLAAVIETASQNSSTTTSKSRVVGGRGDGSRSVRSEDKSRTSSTIATENSLGTLPPRGKCLTQPSEGVSNENFCDNVEGNLIVYENDNISVSKKHVCVLTRGKIPRGAPYSDFRVQSLLGQGTFAQVFKCLHVQTGQLVAVKVVKNKPAYTRQAAIEVDVIRALTTTNGNGNTNDKNANEGISPDYMIDMVCYFKYKDHLCLVFELLGLNLYEVLKKRQFRGLPLAVTQTLVRQAVLGTRTLARRSIVHCDLKPENILLVDEDDSESVMSAGESKRLHGSSSVHSHNTSSSTQKKPPAMPTESNPKKDSTKGNEGSHENEGQTQSSDKSKSTNDTDSTNKNLSKQDEKTQNSGTQLSDNSKSTVETDNTTKKNGQGEKQESKKTKESKTTKMSKSSTQEKGNFRSASKSPMESTIGTNDLNGTQPNPVSSYRIKMIDFGSACFEGQMSHTYIQSRFYRSPEVLLGLAYDSAIDMWSLGCVAAELFLGLPILPGVHEHDQLLRIIEMIGDTPDWMLDQGTKSSKYFVKYVPAVPPSPSTPIQSSITTPEGRSGSTETVGRSGSEGPRPLPQWRIKTQNEYIASLSHSDIEKKGGLAKLQKQPGNRYFKRKRLSDIICHKGKSGKPEDPRLLNYFVHFLYGILDPDPWKRWTAFQVASHPFFTGATMQENIDPSKIKDDNQANRLFNLYWEAPSDPTIYRRKLLNVQKTREKQQAMRRSFNRGHGHSRSRSSSPSSLDGLASVRNAVSNSNKKADDMHPVTSNTDEATNQAGTRLIRQGSYQGSFNMSSSMTRFGSNQNIRLLGHNSGMQLGFSGPQSFSESGNSVGLPGSFNEVDFAVALHRPGVVPMGDSVTTATTSTTSMSSGNNSRSTYNQNNIQISQSGSYSSHQVVIQQRRSTIGCIPRTSRSFGEGDLGPRDSAAIPIVIDSHLQQVVYSSSHESKMEIGPPIDIKPQVEISVDPPIEIKDENIPKRPESETNNKTDGKTPPETIPPTTEDNSSPVTNSKSENNHVQTNQNPGVYDTSQVYQQQLAAMQQQFQQQQMLLQQQQAALALQQEQLRAYYSNISNAAGMNAQQFHIQGTPTTAINSQQFGIPGTPATPASNISNAAGINTQQFGIAGAPATPVAPMNAQQFGIPGAQATASGAINAQQFNIAGTPASLISPQQFGLSNNTPGALQAAALNPQQFGIPGAAAPVQAGGYYVVPSADGTHMIVPTNQGIAIPMSGQLPGIAQLPGIMPGQLQGLPTGPTQIQGLTPTGLPSVGVPPVAAVAGIPGIQGLHAAGMIQPAGSLVPGVGPATGMGPMPSMNNKKSPGPTGIHHRQT